MVKCPELTAGRVVATGSSAHKPVIPPSRESSRVRKMVMCRVNLCGGQRFEWIGTASVIRWRVDSFFQQPIVELFVLKASCR